MCKNSCDTTRIRIRKSGYGSDFLEKIRIRIKSNYDWTRIRLLKNCGSESKFLKMFEIIILKLNFFCIIIKEYKAVVLPRPSSDPGDLRNCESGSATLSYAQDKIKYCGGNFNCCIIYLVPYDPQLSVHFTIALEIIIIMLIINSIL